MVDTSTNPSAIADEVISRINPDEKRLRASRLKPLTFGQYKAIRAEAISLGVPPEVASMLPWYAADPQAMVAALRAASRRKEIVARGVLGVIIELDIMTAVILRSLENMRAEEARYRGKFDLPRYTKTTENDALLADLSEQPSTAAAINYVAAQLEVVDGHINKNSPYGEDIRHNGIRRGGVLFPVVIDLPGGQRIGGFDSTDCYSRTLFAQHHSRITVPTVLDWWQEFPPATPKEFKDHPVKRMRDELVAIADRIVADISVPEADSGRVLRAVMPKTTVVLAVEDTAGLGIDEIRRRLVSERHLDKQLEFTDDTKNETRAEAVIVELTRREMLPERPGFTQTDTLNLLEKPHTMVGPGGLFRDDLVIAAAAVFMPEQKSARDRLIFPAIASRGVITPDDRTNWLRSELATQVIMRLIEDDVVDKREDDAADTPRPKSRNLRKSALERALRQTKLRGAVLDARSVPDLIDAALAELKELEAARRRGESPSWGPAMLQIALRGGFYLFFGRHLALDRSPVGGKKGADNREATQIIETLGTTESGLQQLTQAIYDGRNDVAVRKVEVGGQAQNLTTEPAEADTLTNESLREWLGKAVAEDKKNRQGDDPSARGLVARDALRLSGLTSEAEELIARIKEYADDVETGDGDEVKAPPYVAVNGLQDTDEVGKRLTDVVTQINKWHTVYEVRSGNTDGFGASA